MMLSKVFDWLSNYHHPAVLQVVLNDRVWPSTNCLGNYPSSHRLSTMEWILISGKDEILICGSVLKPTTIAALVLL